MLCIAQTAISLVSYLLDIPWQPWAGLIESRGAVVVTPGLVIAWEHTLTTELSWN